MGVAWYKFIINENGIKARGTRPRMGSQTLEAGDRLGCTGLSVLDVKIES